MTLSERMKQYENVERKYLYTKTPIIIRLDGVHFHSVAKQWKKPWDAVMEYCMNEAAKYVCENLQGIKLAYVQSDEMSFLVSDLDNLETQMPFNGNLQKIVSVSASMATMRFNQVLQEFIRDLDSTDIGCSGPRILKDYGFDEKDLIDLPWNNSHIYNKEVYFDGRAFNLPKDEVSNYFLYRQLDATRNSIESWGQYFYSHKELMGVTCNQLQNKMLTEKDFNWNNLPTSRKRGRCIVKSTHYNADTGVTRHPWIIDNEIPIFSAEGQNYIGQYLPPVSNAKF